MKIHEDEGLGYSSIKIASQGPKDSPSDDT